MRRQQNNFPVMLLRQPLGVSETPDAPNGCYLYLSPFWGALVGRFLECLDTDDVWDVAIADTAREHVRQLMDMVRCDLADQPTIIEKIKTIIVAGGEDDCENDCEDSDMACIKRVRVHEGRLQVSYYEDYQCADCWVDVGDIVLDDSETSLGDTLLDSENRAKDARKIRIQPPVVNIDQEELARCAKATALVDSALLTFQSIIGVRNTPYDIISGIVPVDILIAVIKAILPDEFAAFFALPKLVALAIGVSEDELADVTAFSAGVVREELICRYAKLISDSEQVVGKDLERLAQLLTEYGLESVRVFFDAMRIVNVGALKDVLSKKTERVDCGCGRIVNPTLLPAPDNADWCYLFDFTIDDYSEIWAVTTENSLAGAVWTDGVGYEDTIAAFQKTLSIHHNNFTGTIVGVDATFRNVKAGMLLEENPGTQSSLYMDLTVRESVSGAFVVGMYRQDVGTYPEITIQHRGMINIDNKTIALRNVLAYDGQNYQNIPSNDSGNAVLRSIKMWGKGENPFGVDNC